jgi:hypothetical protein
MQLRHHLIVVCLLTLLAGACTPTPTAAPAPMPTSDGASPTTDAAGIGAYPATEGYPGASVELTLDLNIKPFQLNKPVIEGATKVTGMGPAGVPILLQDVTFTGAPVGETVIGQDGTFTFQVAPLEARHRIGVALGNLDATHFKTQDFSNVSYMGDDAMLVPQIGFYYDTTLVQPKP